LSEFTAEIVIAGVTEDDAIPLVEEFSSEDDELSGVACALRGSELEAIFQVWAPHAGVATLLAVAGIARSVGERPLRSVAVRPA
jgi:hypothetical protein